MALDDGKSRIRLSAGAARRAVEPVRAVRVRKGCALGYHQAANTSCEDSSMNRVRIAHPKPLPGSCAAAMALLVALAVLAGAAAGAPRRALFDNTHAETAGNADWVIDTDQPLPLPDQATVTAATPRTYWLGAVSSWGIDLVKRGYQVAT